MSRFFPAVFSSFGCWVIVLILVLAAPEKINFPYWEHITTTVVNHEITPQICDVASYQGKGTSVEHRFDKCYWPVATLTFDNYNCTLGLNYAFDLETANMVLQEYYPIGQQVWTYHYTGRYDTCWREKPDNKYTIMVIFLGFFLGIPILTTLIYVISNYYRPEEASLPI